jgi:hypothetical protein
VRNWPTTKSLIALKQGFATLKMEMEEEELGE